MEGLAPLLEDEDPRILALEALVEEQQARIAQLEAAEEEVRQLQELVEAQESALNDQRQIMANQSTLVDELNGQLQSVLSGGQAEAELEEIIQEQREKIAQLTATAQTSSRSGNATGAGSEEDMQQLHALIEAQETALNDQRQIIESQSGLIDELNSHVQSGLGEQSDIGNSSPGAAPQPSAPPPGGYGAAPQVPPPGGRPPPPAAAAAASASRHSGVGARRRIGDPASPPPIVPVRGGSSAGMSAASAGKLQKRSQVHQKSVLRDVSPCGGMRPEGNAHSAPSTMGELPRPQPNSASILASRVGGSISAGTSGTPRARSSTGQLSSRAQSPRHERASSPHVRETRRMQSGTMPRRAGGPTPPALPLLRQEA